MRTPSATQREDSGAAIQFGDITISLVSMTPAAAAAILERNTKNRPVKKALVKQISADMSRKTLSAAPARFLLTICLPRSRKAS